MKWTAAPASPDGFSDYVYTIPKLRGSARAVSLEVFIFLSGMWVICDPRLPLLFSGHTVRIVFLSFVAFRAMPICLLLYIRKMLSRESRALEILCLPQALEFLVMYSVVAVPILCVRDMQRRFR